MQNECGTRSMQRKGRHRQACAELIDANVWVNGSSSDVALGSQNGLPEYLVFWTACVTQVFKVSPSREHSGRSVSMEQMLRPNTARVHERATNPTTSVGVDRHVRDSHGNIHQQVRVFRSWFSGTKLAGNHVCIRRIHMSIRSPGERV